VKPPEIRQTDGTPEVQAIVNADDLGMSREVNAAIFDLMARGRVTSASLIANAISHLGSHMHVHLRPIMFPLMKILQRTYAIRGIRTRHNVVAAGHQLGLQSKTKTHVYNWAMRHLYKSVTADAGAELATFIAAEWEPHPRFRTVEALAHPGNPFYPGDIALLLTPWEEALPFPVRLINYYHLG